MVHLSRHMYHMPLSAGYPAVGCRIRVHVFVVLCVRYLRGWTTTHFDLTFSGVSVLRQASSPPPPLVMRIGKTMLISFAPNITYVEFMNKGEYTQMTFILINSQHVAALCYQSLQSIGQARDLLT